MRRAFKWSPLFLLLILTCGIGWLVATESGLRFLVNTTQTWVPGDLKIEQLQGSLLGPISLKGLSYENHGIQIRSEELLFDWQALALLDARLHIRKLHIQDVDIQLLSDEPTAASNPMSDPVTIPDTVELPLELSIDDLRLNNLRYHNSAQTDPASDILIQRIVLSAETERQQVTIHQLEVEAPEGLIAVDGLLDLDDLSTRLNTRWKLTLPDYQPVAGNGTLSGDARDMQIQQQLTQPSGISIQASLFDVLDELRWKANLVLDEFNPQALRNDLPALELNSRLQGSGDLQQFELTANANTRLDALQPGSPQHTLSEEKTNLLKQLGAVTVATRLSGKFTSPWQIQQLDIVLPDHQMQLLTRGDLALANNNLKYNINGQWQNLKWPLTESPDIESSTGQFQIAGSNLEYIASARADYRAHVNGSVTNSGELRLNTSGDPSGLSLQSLTLKTSNGNLDAQGEIQWRLSASDPEPAEQNTEQGSASLSGKTSANIVAESQHFIESLTYELQGQWQELHWPLNAKRTVASPQGHFTLKGKGLSYHTEIGTRLAVADYPPADIAFTGNGTDTQFTATTLKIDSEQGKLDGKANLQWAPDLRWQASLQASAIDISRQFPEWPGQFNALFNTQGKIDNEVISADLELISLEGTLRDFPVQASASAQLRGDNIIIENLDWQSGEARLHAQGKLDSQWQLSWSLQAQDLSAFWPGLGGQANATGKLSGEREKPRLEMDLAANDLSLDQENGSDINLATLKGLFDIDLGNRQTSSIDLSIEQLQLDDQKIDKIALGTEGTLDNQEWQLLMERGDESLRLSALGGYQNSVWKGSLNNLQFDTSLAGIWKLEQVTAITIGLEQVRTDTLCLASDQQQGKLCLGGEWASGKDARLEAELQSLSTNLIDWFLPDSLQWKDSLSGHLRATIKADRRFIMDSDFQLGPGQLEFVQLNQESLSFAYRQGKISAVTDNQGTRVNFSLALETGDELLAKINLPGFTRLAVPDDQQVIEGHVTGSYGELGLVSLFVPDIQDVTGIINTDLTLAGSWGTPAVSGSASLKDASFTLPGLGTHVHDIGITLTTQGSHVLTIDGSAISGDGKITLGGKWIMDANQGWPMTLSVDGKNLDLARQPGLLIIASPRLDISTHDRQINIKGTVEIPRTDIELLGLPASSITPSSDVVIINEEAEIEDRAAQPWKINTQVRVVLGNRVNFEGFGLSGRAQGDLTIIQTPDKPMVGTGRLEIIDGVYRAYGMELKVEQGQLIFANSPLDNPAIEVSATRTITGAVDGTEETIVAGLRAQGRLKDATLSLYSDPPLEQTDILSYLLLGRPAGDTSEKDSDLLVAAAAAIGTSEAFLATKRLAQSLGFEDVRVNRTGLVMGKSLSDRLYLSYEIGLLQPQNTLQLRYTLTDNWTVKVETNESQSADLLYTIER